jgi:carbohydrate-binding DOMON domain-containing protein
MHPLNIEWHMCAASFKMCCTALMYAIFNALVLFTRSHTHIHTQGVTHTYTSTLTHSRRYTHTHTHTLTHTQARTHTYTFRASILTCSDSDGDDGPPAPKQAKKTEAVCVGMQPTDASQQQLIDAHARQPWSRQCRCR